MLGNTMVRATALLLVLFGGGVQAQTRDLAEREKLEGVWRLVRCTVEGKDLSAEQCRAIRKYCDRDANWIILGGDKIRSEGEVFGFQLEYSPPRIHQRLRGDEKSHHG